MGFRRRNFKPLLVIDYKILKSCLKQLPPSLRHSILFKPNYSQHKNNSLAHKQCSSDFIGFLIFNSRTSLSTTDFDSFFSLLDYLIEESNIFYGNYNSLVKDIIPNRSAIHYLIKFSECIDHMKTFFNKYAFVISNQSQSYRLSLLVYCLKHSVDISIVRHMIYLGIINIDTIKQKKQSIKKKHLTVSIAYYIAVFAFKQLRYHDNIEDYNYLVQFTNLIIGVCNSDHLTCETKQANVVYVQPGKQSPPKPEVTLKRLTYFNKVFLFKNIVKEAYNEIPFPPRKSEIVYYKEKKEYGMLPTFFDKFYRFCLPEQDVIEQDETPLDELVGFDRYKFGKLSAYRRRR